MQLMHGCAAFSQQAGGAHDANKAEAVCVWLRWHVEERLMKLQPACGGLHLQARSRWD